MGLSNEGLWIGLGLIWSPILIFHFFIFKKSKKLVDSILDPNLQLKFKMVTFGLITVIHVVGITLSIICCMEDREENENWLIRFFLFLVLLIPGMSSITLPGGPDTLRYVLPRDVESVRLAVRRGLFIGIPFSFLFSSMFLIFANFNFSVNSNFIHFISCKFDGLSGTVMGILSCLTFGPVIDPFAPGIESVFVYPEQNQFGISSYFLYIVLLDIGLLGVLYPLCRDYFKSIRMAIVISGIITTSLRLPFVPLQYSEDYLTFTLYPLLLLVEQIALRAVVVSISLPIRAETLLPASALLHTPSVVRPGILPSAFVHASILTWGRFWSSLWIIDSPIHGLLFGPECSLVTVTWQSLVAYILIRSI
jgi:hypothetical protein